MVIVNQDNSIAISLINAYLYCKRRAGLISIESVFIDNHHTIKGKYVHKRIDVFGSNNISDVNYLRSLSVWSKKLAIYGKCDIVEKHQNGGVVPVEYKKGVVRNFDNDNCQLCAQALCLEEMFNIDIDHGFIFHASSKRRRKVEFSKSLRDLTKNTIDQIHQLISSQQVPSAVKSIKCQGCSLNQYCLPEVTDLRLWKYKKNNVFQLTKLSNDQ